jgi:hypothetical protein
MHRQRPRDAMTSELPLNPVNPSEPWWLKPVHARQLQAGPTSEHETPQISQERLQIFGALRPLLLG